LFFAFLKRQSELKLFLQSSILFIFLLAVTSNRASAQYFKLKGTVYDSTKTYPVSSVSVLSTSGKGTLTDAYGRYELDVKETDSVWFSYLNKPTIKYSIAKIFVSDQFDIALHVNIPVLKEVVIRPRNYKMDSLQNRLDYAKGFNWEKPKLKANVGTDMGAAVGFDLDEMIRMFQFRKNKSMSMFRDRLLRQEQDKFIDYRFSKALVLRLTGLIGEERDDFMMRYRPDYEFCLAVGEYDFQAWIKNCYERYKEQKKVPLFKRVD
jgi:hypothetical protein